MKQPIKLKAEFKGKSDLVFKNGETYTLVVRNSGAITGKLSGRHDTVWIEGSRIGTPYTLRGFLENWKILEVYD